MIKSQCECCKKFNTLDCDQSINYDGTSCPFYIKKIDLSKKNVTTDGSLEKEPENNTVHSRLPYGKAPIFRNSPAKTA